LPVFLYGHETWSLTLIVVAGNTEFHCKKPRKFSNSSEHSVNMKAIGEVLCMVAAPCSASCDGTQITCVVPVALLLL
jgi:hypothetical protein